MRDASVSSPELAEYEGGTSGSGLYLHSIVAVIAKLARDLCDVSKQQQG